MEPTKTIEIEPIETDSEVDEYEVTVQGGETFTCSEVHLPSEQSLGVNIVDSMTLVDYPGDTKFSVDLEKGRRYDLLTSRVQD